MSAFDKPPRFAYGRQVSTKRNVKPFSRNPKNKARVLAPKSSVLKANSTFRSKPKARAKTAIAKIKKARKAVIAPVILPVAIPTPAPLVTISAEVEQANKLAITLQLAKINETLKVLKDAAREQCATHIQTAETKAISARAAVYLKAKKAGKFPTTWTYPKEFLP